MYCPSCSAQVADGSSFCTACGAPMNQQPQVNQEANQSDVYYTPPAADDADVVNAPAVEEPVVNTDNANQYQQQVTEAYGNPNPGYQQPNQPYGNPNYSQQNPYDSYQQPFVNPEIVQKGEKAKTLAIVGIIVGLFIPLVGWICGGKAITQAKAALQATGDQKFKTNHTLGIVAVVVSTVSWALALITIL